MTNKSPKKGSHSCTKSEYALHWVPILAMVCFPFVADILFTHVALLIIYVLVPFICLVVASEPSEPEEAIITKKVLPEKAIIIKKVSPFYTKGIYLYALPLPMFLLVILVPGQEVWEVILIIRLCVVLYILAVVINGLIEIKVREDKGD